MSVLSPRIIPSLGWMELAKSYIGTKAEPGPFNNIEIMNWLKSLKAWWFNDRYRWDATFVSYCLTNNLRELPRFWMYAGDYRRYSQLMNTPYYGDICVYKSLDKKETVGFVYGKVKGEKAYWILGVNNNERVEVFKVLKERIIEYRSTQHLNGIPDVANTFERQQLPVLCDTEIPGINRDEC